MGMKWPKRIHKLGAVFLLNLSSHYQMYIAEYLFTKTDDYFESLSETTVLTCQMYISGFRPFECTCNGVILRKEDWVRICFTNFIPRAS